MKNYFILHGSFASPYSNWFGWLTNQINLMEEGNVYTPSFPIGVGYQTYENWSKLFDAYVSSGLVNSETTIIAHSIAPVFISKYLVSHKLKVKKLIFVCGFNNYFGINEDFDEVNHTMYFDNLASVKNFADEIVCFFSDNDPYVKFDAEKAFAEEVGAKQHLLSGAGHINAESGFTSFKEILKEL